MNHHCSMSYLNSLALLVPGRDYSMKNPVAFQFATVRNDNIPNVSCFPLFIDQILKFWSSCSENSSGNGSFFQIKVFSHNIHNHLGLKTGKQNVIYSRFPSMFTSLSQLYLYINTCMNWLFLLIYEINNYLSIFNIP